MAIKQRQHDYRNGCAQRQYEQEVSRYSAADHVFSVPHDLPADPFIIVVRPFVSASVAPGKTGRDYFQNGLINRADQGREDTKWSK